VHGVGRAALVLSAAAGLGLGAQQQAPVFKSSTQTVPVYVTVLDDGHLVTDLKKDDFTIFDNGRQQTITLFDSSIQPISIVIMLDTSGSMVGNIPLLRSSAVQMFTRLMPADKARLGNFGNQISLSPKFTNVQDDLIRWLWSELDAGGPTPLWAAVNVAMTAMSQMEGRRVVLVLSDGKDTGSLRGFGRPGPPSVIFQDIVLRAQTEDFMVYSIGLASKGGPYGNMGAVYGAYFGRALGKDEPDPGLRLIAEESGGGYFEITENTALGPAFARVADELHRQYLLGYVMPESDGRAHTVTVRVNRPGVIVRARHSYVAPRRDNPSERPALEAR
jgi:VWFA-related protein